MGDAVRTYALITAAVVVSVSTWSHLRAAPPASTPEIVAAKAFIAVAGLFALGGILWALSLVGAR